MAVGMSNGWGVFSFTGFFLFGGTILLLIFFGAIIPSIIRSRGIRRVKNDPSAHIVPATISEVRLLSTTTIGNYHLVSETFLITFDTSYGKSKTTYKIKNTVGRRYTEGEQISVLINPSKPKYCTIAENLIQ
jgi:hypothetical protein